MSAFIGIALLLLAASALLLPVFIYLTASAGIHATHVETGGFKFVVAGKSFVRVLDNIPGHYVDTDGKVKAGIKLNRSWLERTLGIFWISIYWPFFKLHEFEIAHDKMKLASDITPETSPQDWVLVVTRNGSYLRWRFPHPLILPEVELGGDRWKINLGLMIDFEVVRPRIVAFDLKGTREVLRFVDAAIESTARDFCNGYTKPGKRRPTLWTYQMLLAENLGRGSYFDEEIKKLNTGVGGIEERYGMRVASARVTTLDLSQGQKELDDAIRLDSQRKAEAQAAISQSLGQKESLMNVGAGQAAAVRARIQARIDLGVSPDIAALADKDEAVAALLHGSGVATWAPGKDTVVTINSGRGNP
jgi:hypothetical protein